MGELEVPSLDQVHDMSWREFHLKKHAYERKQLRKWEHTRMIAYWSGAGTAFDPQKTKIESFMPLNANNKVHEISSETKERFKRLQEEYLKKANGGK